MQYLPRGNSSAGVPAWKAFLVAGIAGASPRTRRSCWAGAPAGRCTGGAGSGTRRRSSRRHCAGDAGPSGFMHRAGWRGSWRPASAGPASIRAWTAGWRGPPAMPAAGIAGGPARAGTCAGTNALEWSLLPCRRYNLMVCAQDW